MSTPRPSRHAGVPAGYRRVYSDVELLVVRAAWTRRGLAAADASSSTTAVTAPSPGSEILAQSDGLLDACITFCDTEHMAKAISVRLDDEAERALRTLEASGMNRSEAIRSSLLISAQRLRHRESLVAEAAALEADDEDRDEMLAVAALMESLRAAG